MIGFGFHGSGTAVPALVMNNRSQSQVLWRVLLCDLGVELDAGRFFFMHTAESKNAQHSRWASGQSSFARLGALNHTSCLKPPSQIQNVSSPPCIDNAVSTASPQTRTSGCHEHEKKSNQREKELEAEHKWEHGTAR
ncbi:predicted protein [Uncinocarpus reesii 1704]|uniref:Uncharacterized protein n=1 Tax=Uncinocarpus reesii (strain UAMH 1704) TaxID=336963 RepID=C4JU81_UNCRE|nr:uncharacterized protein UREG_06020 [Uncinocarpus reesii 1704]EEP81178.1 predicted protein [Uncinocarpus reesii 1704]